MSSAMCASSSECCLLIHYQVIVDKGYIVRSFILQPIPYLTDQVYPVPFSCCDSSCPHPWSTNEETIRGLTLPITIEWRERGGILPEIGSIVFKLVHLRIILYTFYILRYFAEDGVHRVLKKTCCQNPNPNLNTTQRLGLTWKWLCKPPPPPPHSHTNSMSAISQLLLTRRW